MKVLFILPEFYPHPGGGLATYYLQYLPLLKKKGIDIHVIVGSAFVQGNETYQFQGIQVEYLRPGLFQQYLAKFRKLDLFPELQRHLASAWALWEQAEKGTGYDIVETTDWGYGYLPWSLKKTVPVVTRLHGSCAQIETFDPKDGQTFHDDLLRILEIQSLPLSSELVTYSKNNQAFWEKRLPKTVNYIPPIFETPEIEARVEQQPPGSPYSLVVGRIQNWKGPELLCRALEYIPDTFPIYWIGRDTDYKKKGNSYSTFLSKEFPKIWGKRIIPLGAKSHAEVLEWMRKAHFGIVPSTWDMFNFTVLEWAKLKKPILCSEGAGAWNLVPAPEGGATFPSNSPEELAHLLSEYQHSSAEELTEKGNVAFESTSKKLDPEKLLDKNISVYSRLISSRNQLASEKIDLKDWKTCWFVPSDHSSGREVTMSQWPLRELVKHVSYRVKNKLTGKK